MIERDRNPLPEISTADFAPAQRPEPGLPATHAARAPRSIGEFEILGVLGEGGMGVVYRAAQDRPRREVAIKVMRPGTASEERLRRFEHETQTLGRLQHPGIAQIYFAGVAETEQGSQPYLAMELVAGATLSHRLAASPLGVCERVALTIKVCEAVHHAHQKGVIHRDLKPANILVDETGQPKIVDFGVARLSDAETADSTAHTTAGQLVGTLPYMSPEQVAGDPQAIDVRSDVYTLGVICYEMLAGRLPYDFGGRSAPEIIRAISSQEPARLSTHDRSLRGDLQIVLAKALEKDKDRRYQSASEFAADLSRFLANEPIAARPASAWYQIRKLARRNRAATAGLAAAAVLLAAYAVTTGMLWQSERSQRARVQGLLDDNSRLLGDRTLQAADLAAQRGRWTVALEHYVEAAQNPVNDRDEVRLKAAIANLNLNRIHEAKNEFDALAAAPLSAEMAARVGFWRGVTLADFDDDASQELLRSAVASESLSKVERLYAEALLAPTTPVRIEKLRATVEADPFFLHARQLLMLHQMLLGDFSAAETTYEAALPLYPDDPNLTMVNAVRLAATGRLAEAQALLAGASQQLGPEQTALLNEVFAIFGLAHDYVQAKHAHNAIRLFAIEAQLTFAVTRLVGAAAAVQGLQVAPEQFLSLGPAPRLLKNTYGRLLVVIEQIALGQTDAALAELDEAIRVHPEGFLRAMRGQLHYNAGRLAEAEADFQAALDGPALVPVQDIALDMLFASQWPRPLAANASQELKQGRLKTMRQLLDLHRANEGRNFDAALAFQMADAADVLGEYDFGREIVTFYERHGPPSAAVLLERGTLEFRQGAYGRALEALREAEKLPPENEQIREHIAASIPRVTLELQSQADKLAPRAPPATVPATTGEPAAPSSP